MKKAYKINLAKKRHLLNKFKLATELGAEVIKIKSDEITKTIINLAVEKEITTICIGKPHFNLFQLIISTSASRKHL